MKKPWNPVAEREDAIAACAILIGAGRVLVAPYGTTVGPYESAVAVAKSAVAEPGLRQISRFGIFYRDRLDLTCSTPEYAAQRFVDLVGAGTARMSIHAACSRAIDAA